MWYRLSDTEAVDKLLNKDKFEKMYNLYFKLKTVLFSSFERTRKRLGTFGISEFHSGYQLL